MQDSNAVEKQAPGEIPVSDKSASSAAPAEIVSIVKSEYVLGQRALNSAQDHELRRDSRRAAVEKTGVPSNAMAHLDAWSAKIDAMDTDAPGDTAMLSRASSSVSDFSTESVADSIHTNDKEAPGDAHESEMHDISAVSTPSAPMQELCLETLEQEPASGAASISTSRVQVLNMRA